MLLYLDGARVTCYDECMKKSLGTILFLILIVFSINTIRAQEQSITGEIQLATNSSEYKLPHVGMLPDSPFYKLKSLRDRVTLFFISDRERKAEKHLDFADRMLYESLKVAENGNMTVAVHNAFKGEDHMTQLVDSLKASVYSGKELDKDFVARAHEAYTAHQNLLAGIKSRTDDKDQQKSLDTIIEFSTRNDAELTKLENDQSSNVTNTNDTVTVESEVTTKPSY